ncbi:Trehalose utilization [Planctomycetes bacterium Pan216]|uniref:Trehalose utilization n=1 Tax=Kolteria novifilia TaxID=2527975 RepID=A0A518AYM3_9BACT|nr:Trehalose utilization [Planctomycetes bacterium Pan216]
MRIALSAALLCGLLASPSLLLAAESGDAQKKADGKPKVLLLTKSSGYEHGVVRRPKKEELSHVEKTMVAIGKEVGVDVEPTKDASKLNAENLKDYDAVFLMTTGDLDKPGNDGFPAMKKEDRQAILDFIKQGGGIVMTHCGGADTFHGWVEEGRKPFLEMVGGEFATHGRVQPGAIEVIEPSFPGMEAFPTTFSLPDEWYVYKGLQPNLRILMMLNTSSLDQKDRNGAYARPNYPITWCSSYGKGRVYYTGMGHHQKTWDDPRFQKMLGQAMLWSAGKKAGENASNLERIFGSQKVAMERLNPPPAKK